MRGGATTTVGRAAAAITVVLAAACTDGTEASPATVGRTLQPAVTEVATTAPAVTSVPPTTSAPPTTELADDFVSRCIRFVHIKLDQGETRAAELWYAAGGTDTGLAAVCADIEGSAEAESFRAEMDALDRFLASVGSTEATTA